MVKAGRTGRVNSSAIIRPRRKCSAERDTVEVVGIEQLVCA